MFTGTEMYLSRITSYPHFSAQNWTLSDTAGLSHLIPPAPTHTGTPPSAFNATVTVPKSQQSFPDAEAVPSQNAGLEVFPITAIHPQMKKGFRVVLRGNGSRPLIASSSVGVGKDQVLATSRILSDCHTRRGRPNKETKTSKCATAARPKSKFRMGVEVHRLHAQRVSKTIHGHKTC